LTRLRLSPAAENDLTEIWFYIAQDNVEAADRFADLVYEKCQLLAESPGMGTQRPELAPEVRSFPVGNYVIFYRPTENGVEVVRVLSGHRDIQKLFEKK